MAAALEKVDRLVTLEADVDASDGVLDHSTCNYKERSIVRTQIKSTACAVFVWRFAERGHNLFAGCALPGAPPPGRLRALAAHVSRRGDLLAGHRRHHLVD